MGMRKKDQERIMEIVKDEIRKGNVSEGKDVLLILPELLETVELNQKLLKAGMEKCMDSRNPFNGILKMFGLQIINKDEAMNSLVIDINDEHAKKWISADEGEVKQVVEKISARLYEMESEAAEKYNAARQRGDELFDKCNRLEKEYSALRAKRDIEEKMIAERIQQMLAEKGKEAIQENDPLVELLKDINIEVYWDALEIGLSDAEMFTEYKVDADVESPYLTKPCLVRDGKVFEKGVRLVS